MSAAWQFGGLNPGAKLVLLALCDNASDEGACFPSIRTLAAKCCMAERTVQGHISAFEADGLLTRVERPGRSTVYTLNPRSFCTPAVSAPPQNLHPTPAKTAPPPPQFLHPTPAVSAPITIKEPSGEPSGNQKRAQRERSAPPSTPEDVAPQVWSDWLQLRKAKKAPVTDTVIHGARAEAVKAGMTFTEFLTEWCARGSQGLKAEWLNSSQQAGRQPAKPSRHTGFETTNYREGISDDGTF